MRLRPELLFAGLTALMIVAGQPRAAIAEETAAAQAATGTPTVRIDNFTFTPAEIAVEVGTTVTWVNGDDIPHTVVATNKAFRSKVMDTDQRFQFTFTSPGIYDYFCSLHPHMTGKVIVK